VTMTLLTQHLSKRGMSRSVGGCGVISKTSRCTRYDIVRCIGRRDAMGGGPAVVPRGSRPVTGEDMLRSSRKKGMFVTLAMARENGDESQNADGKADVGDGMGFDEEHSVEHASDGGSPGIGKMFGGWLGAVVSSFDMMRLPSWRWHIPSLGPQNTVRYRMYQSDEGCDSATYRGVMHSANLPQGLVESVGVLDAQDAMEACSGLWGHEKEECFSIFGVDKDADLWFDVVYKLEKALERETDPDEDAFHQGKERC